MRTEKEHRTERIHQVHRSRANRNRLTAQVAQIGRKRRRRMEPLPRAKRRTDGPPLLLTLTFLLVVSALVPMPTPATGSSSSSNYNAYNYDLTTPMFTPDGRLLQVEYASSAAEHSSPLVAVPVPPRTTGARGGDDGDGRTGGGVVLACLSAGAGAGAGRGGRRSTSTHGQRRLVEIPIGPGRGGGRGPGASVVLGLSGVLADNLALVGEVRRHVDSWHRSYGAGGARGPLSTPGNGDDAARAAGRIAGVIGDCCQSHSFGGGIRPYGATVLVCGVDGLGGVALCTAYPSGSVVRHRTDQYLGGAPGSVLGGGDNDDEEGGEEESDPSKEEMEAERRRRHCCVVLGGTEADRAAIHEGVSASILASRSRGGSATTPAAELGAGVVPDDEDEGDDSSSPSPSSPSAEFRAAAEAAVEDLLDRYRKGEDSSGGGGREGGAAEGASTGVVAAKAAAAKAAGVLDFRVAAEAAVEALLSHHGRSREKTKVGGSDGPSPAGTGLEGRDRSDDDAATITDDDESFVDADADVDVVLLTSSDGVHRLSGAETAALIDSIRRRQRTGREK